MVLQHVQQSNGICIAGGLYRTTITWLIVGCSHGNHEEFKIVRCLWSYWWLSSDMLQPGF